MIEDDVVDIVVDELDLEEKEPSTLRCPPSSPNQDKKVNLEII